MTRHIESFKPLQLPSKLSKQFSKNEDGSDDETDNSRFQNLPGYRDKSRKTLTRKEQRKQEREDKKKRKDDFYRSKTNKKQRLDEDGNHNQQQTKQQPKQQPKQQQQQPKQPKKSISKVEKVQNKMKQDALNEQKKLAFLKSIGRTKADLMSSDDREIAYLEKKLGLNKKKGKKSEEDEDGLGEFMNEPNKKSKQTKSQKSVTDEIPDEENDDPSYISDIFDDLEKALAGGYSDEDEEENEDDAYNYDDDLEAEQNDSEEGNNEDDEEEELEEDQDDEEIQDDEAEYEDQDEEDVDQDEDEEDEEDEEMDEEENKKYIKEDIYGRIVNTKTGEIIKDNKGVSEGSAPSNKYVPPHLRNQPQQQQQKQDQNATSKPNYLNIEVDPILKKKINGLMNKLAINNFYTIFNEISELFDNNPRNSMKQILTQLILTNCSESTQVVHSIIHIYTALISGLHSSIGTDIGGHIIEAIFSEYNRIYSDCNSSTSLISNYVLLFIHLYNFQVLGSKIIFDMAKNFIDSFKDIDVQLILLLLQNAGYQLRGEDPVTLKDIILIVQKKQQEYKQKRQEEILKDPNAESKLTPEELEKSAKLTFMMDTISNLKNNKIKNTKLIDTLTSLKKAIKSVLRARDLSMNSNQMKISWDDLANIETKGRWWLVGSSWAGNDVNPLLGITSKAAHLQPTDSGIKLKTFENNSKLLKLAIANKMNTDLRKTIFCILMTSEDFSDAFDKIMELKLKDKQDREVIHVLMHCCLKEKKFNPYYYHLVHRLCIHDSNFKFTLQYCIWDHLKDLESETDISYRLNQQLQPIEIVFFRLLFTYLLTLPDESSVSTIFERLVTSTQSRISATKESQSNALSLTKGISIFFVHGLLSSNSKSEPNYKLIKDRIKFVKKIFKSNETILL
ncbi:hypothetical protein DICPUDRAFT_160053 [Dictyostelium purpureum]|uniref:MI domain-containing protein n=1 Tax=Dictyostelium purpureum TaxID=5786 RepID=F1A5L4_DICPU|nr:uncharacterized protein DICPUDRAFT_160053 [Dictyostelium purpureum]EGC28514.1 hypothetical protein DICPUDRAFT_160053 [Dictyostelium purpureum]|eukprot:XP_003294958.1 hypothetical protein DICPUDRAFT_160053 [Dictyostelium purpureum]